MNFDFLHLATVSAIVVATIVLAYIFNRFFIRLINRSTTEMKNDPTSYQFLRRAVIASIYLVGFGIAIYMIPSLRSLAHSMLAGAGILAVAIGFASQAALSNIISGFFIVIFKPFRINDILKVKDLIGVVEDITLRHVVIRDYENKRIIIPNSIISNESVVNSNLIEDKICKWINIGISYSSNISLAREIMKDEIINHPHHIDPRTPLQIEEGKELVPVRVIELADSCIQLRAWAWAPDNARGFEMMCDLLESIKLRFDKEGIIIPFPQRDVHLTSSNLSANV